jgi:hypothetical protein
MNTAALVKAAKSPVGALLIGFLTRELAAAAGFTIKAVVKGVIRHSVVAQRGIKAMMEEVKAEISELADEAIKEADLIEKSVEPKPATTTTGTTGTNATTVTATKPA